MIVADAMDAIISIAIDNEAARPGRLNPDAGGASSADQFGKLRYTPVTTIEPAKSAGRNITLYSRDATLLVLMIALPLLDYCARYERGSTIQTYYTNRAGQVNRFCANDTVAVYLISRATINM